jgi:hypothetical protein
MRLLVEQLPAVDPNSRADERASEDGNHEQSHGCQPDSV